MSLGGQTRSLMSGFGIGGLMGLVIWFFLWLQVRDKEEYKKQINILSISALIVGILSLIAFMIPSSKMPFLWPKNNPILSIESGWSITGSLLGEVVLFLFLVLEWIKRLVIKLKEKANFNDYFKEAIVIVFLGLLFLLNIYKTVKTGWVYLDGKSSWVIAVETLKNSPIFGMGPGNFVEAFSRFRPASFNLTKMWGSSFGISAMGILQIWTELGLVGLIMVILMVINWLKQWKKSGFWQVGILGLAVFLLPFSFITIFLLFWVIASNFDEVKDKKMGLRLGDNGFNIMPYLVTLLILVVIGFSGFKIVKIVLGDYYWRQSLVATSKNDGTNAYNLQIKAIGINPTMADYRAIYSQTNLALAQNFLNKEGEITDDDKEKASTLVQQAIREAKAAVTLDGNLSAYWSNLGAIYRSLIGIVDGAIDWSLQSYQQAVITDPVNPSLNMELGSLLYGAGNFSSAERAFEEVLIDKSDFANAWYNWAYAAKEQNKLQDAVNRLQQAVNLVPNTSADYERANEELNTWKKELDEATKKQAEETKAEIPKETETLITPEVTPSP
jgi:Tfp pilus assembly protein PilF